MKKAAAIAGMFAFACFSLLLTSHAQQSKAKTTTAQEMQMPQPGPEMEKLKFLVGTWDLKGGYEKSPMFPDGGAQTGWYTAQLGPGGFSVIADFKLEGPLGKEVGHEILTWDPKQNSYSAITVGNAFPGANIGISKWEGANFVTVHDFEFGGMNLHLRSVISKIQEKSLHMEEFSQSGEGAYLTVWKADATKK
jgi:hypothetical protein